LTLASGGVPAVAYQGEPGAYGEEAVSAYFGDAVDPCPMPTFTAACAAVVDGRTAAALLPVENSLAGTVGESLDALAATALTVVGELLLPVRHHLLGLPGASLEEIREVASHPQALAQCEPWLARRGWRLQPAYNTAGAARQVAEAGDVSLAAIASPAAASRYGLVVLAGDLAAADENLTRFIVASRSGDEVPVARGPLAPASGAPRSALVLFETRHVAGALHDALGAFADAGVSLSRIESRPTRASAWRYRFLVQVDGDAGEDPTRAALDELRRRAHGVRVLGSFAAAR
jgi:prephenate dehydratase